MSELKIWVLIPALNEAAQVEQFASYMSEVVEACPSKLRAGLHVCFVDSGSSDGTPDRIRGVFGGKLPEPFQLLESQLGQPSIARALNFAIPQLSSSDYLLIHPVDCKIPPEAWVEFWQWVSTRIGSEPAACAFPKRYTESNWLLESYASLLNGLLLRGLKWWVWTNLICVRRDTLAPGGLEAAGFLEDLLLSRRLRMSGVTMHALNTQVWVSSRRYQKDGALKRIFRNGVITLLFVTGLTSIERLKRFYTKR